MVEATRVLIESGIELGGNLTLFTHSLHEAPVGHMEALKAIIARGDVFVDAALVAESGFDTLSVSGKGQMIFEIDVNRDGAVDAIDLAAVLNTWGSADASADIDGNGVVGATDLAAVLSAWTGG